MDKKSEELWNTFYESGKISDYLNYRKSCSEEEIKNAVEYLGNSNQGTDNKRK